MAIQYDANIIRAHAQELYDQARGITYTAGFLGFVIGGVGGAVVDGMAKTGGPLAAVFFALVGMIFGIRHARGRAFVLQLQAQTSLCQVAIEANTRRSADTVMDATRPAETAHLTQAG